MLVKNQKPDFVKSIKTANEILVASAVINTFPFLPKDLVAEQSLLVCRSYKNARKYGINVADFGSESATIFEFHRKGIIFYNETKPKSHIAFSVLHEFGHYKLGHDFSKKDEEAYHRYEVETNFFCGTVAYARANYQRVSAKRKSYNTPISANDIRCARHRRQISV